MDISEKYIKMCEAAKEIQHKWHFKFGDFVYDPDFEEVQALLYYPVGESTEYVWLPRQDQLQEICIELFTQNLRISEFEAYLRFLDWYSGCLRETFEHGLKKEYGFVDSGEELMINNVMTMLHGKTWDGEKWGKALKGYEPKENSELSIN